MDPREHSCVAHPCEANSSGEGQFVPGVVVQPELLAVVEDDKTSRLLVRYLLENAGHSVMEYALGRDILTQDTAALTSVCLDLGLEDMSGLHVLQHLHAQDPELPVIVITGEQSIETVVEAMHAGAYDYLTKPVNRERLLPVVQRAIERRQLTRRVHRLEADLGAGRDGSSSLRRGLDRIIGAAPAMAKMKRHVERVLHSDVVVCIQGESGTGKELVARAIHDGGKRHGGPFVALNCAAIPQGLLDSELFGHERGAFTGAFAAHKGCFERADGGVLLLDELGEMSAATQASLLRVLQERKVRRVGGAQEIPIDVRIVCATNRDLEADVGAGRFREDLFFRLVVYPLEIPPLRERREDIPLLWAHFVQVYGPELGRAGVRTAPRVFDALAVYRWPGNVRELQNVARRALLLCDGKEILLAHLPPSIQESALPPIAPPSQPARAAEPETDEVVPLSEVERRTIQRALEITGGQVAQAAKLLGISRATLYRRMAEGTLPVPRSSG